MLALISSIPTTVRERFEVQDLPPRASTVSEDTLENLFGGKCLPAGVRCVPMPRQCCPGLKCRRVDHDLFCRRF